jgi:hypothetical protein
MKVEKRKKLDEFNDVERVTNRKKWKILFDRPKPTVGCSASGRRRPLGYSPYNRKVHFKLNVKTGRTESKPWYKLN